METPQPPDAPASQADLKKEVDQLEERIARLEQQREDESKQYDREYGVRTITE